jgi:transcription elongation factor Elf1
MATKWCYACEQEKDVKDFAENRARPDGRSNMCKACKKSYNAEYYETTKDRHNPGRIARRERAQQEAREMVYQYLREHPCMDCGESDVVVLDFDHLGDKVATINTLIKRGSAISTIQAEMAKCEVVCANDHRRRTARTQLWRRADVISAATSAASSMVRAADS